MQEQDINHPSEIADEIEGLIRGKLLATEPDEVKTEEDAKASD